jgi:hypothetical protein
VKWVLLAAIVLLPGCIGLGGRVSTVTMPDGKAYRVVCQSDGRVKYKDGTVEIEVDNRGPAGQVLGAAANAVARVKDMTEDSAK